jgi:predicted DNA-binding transcriptional regulator AlpA
MPAKHKKYYTTSEAAAMLGVSTKTIKNRVKSNFFTPKRTETGRLRFTESDLRQYGPLDFNALELKFPKEVKTGRK